MAKKETKTEKATTPADVQEVNIVDEAGVTGVKIASGYVWDEFLNELQGLKGRKKYREMQDNDATIGAMLMAVQMILRSVKIYVEPAEDDVENFYSEFVEEDMNGLEQKWPELISDVLSMLAFGFSIFELTYYKRQDGMIGTKKAAPRTQETIERWDIDEATGDVKGFWQQPPFGGSTIYIPISKCLHFRTTLNRNNPEGRSILRNAYKNYHFIKNIQMIEAIGIERDLSGLPVLKVPSEVLTNPEHAAKKQAYQSLVRDVKNNSQGGVVLPSEPWPDSEGRPSGTAQYELMLLSAEGTKSVDADKVIKRHQGDALRSVLADFLMIATSGKGSMALSKTMTELFYGAIEGYMGSICAEMDRRYIDNLWQFNGFPEEMKPCFKYGAIKPVDLVELGDFISKMAGAGFLLNDEETENVIRDVAGLPEANRDGLGLGLDPEPDEEDPDDDQTTAEVDKKRKWPWHRSKVARN